ncbi:hypothetical protein AK812_SmicGene15072 [Symbiodinium microadriaticum]|uniref:Uncharacterized protein n=1 Tax=Symbiodinium microadriaticum TaxID=2951 RepID=A0A1Q9E3Z7_SYMMI|nr:hypothetical protein AK812_SmicGene15072 [Symbiodinium microadriaticum]
MRHRCDTRATHANASRTLRERLRTLRERLRTLRGRGDMRASEGERAGERAHVGIKVQGAAGLPSEVQSMFQLFFPDMSRCKYSGSSTVQYFLKQCPLWDEEIPG